MDVFFLIWQGVSDINQLIEQDHIHFSRSASLAQAHEAAPVKGVQHLLLAALVSDRYDECRQDI